VLEIVTALLTESKLLSSLETEGTDESLGRAENLREFLSVVAEYEQNNPNGSTLEEFVEWLALRTDLDEVESGEGYVTLMTVHTSKGLEFPVVFVAGMEEQLFPHSNSLESESDMEEERRLGYVAITRARERLYLLRAKQRFLYGQRKMLRPSRFLAELPPEVLEAPADFVTGIAPAGRSSGNFWKDRLGTPASSPAPSSAPRSRTGAGVPIYGADPLESLQKPRVASTVVYARGDLVRHRSFGVGVVQKVAGDKLTVRFESGAEKTLLASFAPLEKIS
jgi:DNA helicase-2/ATP-dependent DNA helicase PcrA